MSVMMLGAEEPSRPRRLGRVAWRPPAGLLVALGGVAGVLAVLVAALMAATGGHFVFTLDDPYIHLSLAEQILHGGYGVNPGEPASAASSLVFPYIDAVLLALGAGPYAPLFVNLPALAAAVACLWALARRGRMIRGGDPAIMAGLVVAFLAVVLNWPGLALSGMEHSLQLALALAALLGVARLGSGERAPWLPLVLALSPLVRFEGFAVLASGCAALVVAGRVRTAALTLVAGCALAFAFMARLHAMGLPWLPSSVMVKAHEQAGGVRLILGMETQSGVLLAALALAPVLSELADGRSVLAGAGLDMRARVALFVAPILLAHLLLGPMGALNRYEAYALALGVGGAVVIYGARLREAVVARGPAAFAAAAIALSLILLPEVDDAASVPVCARSLWLQQVQMHRLAVALHAPVAVNDLGQVSFRNDEPVLDLWGLGSEAARIARASQTDPAWMDRLARAEGVRLVMIYDPWFPQAPANWVKLGELSASVPTNFGPNVSFYALDARSAPQVRQVIERWAPGLPREARFDPTRTARDNLAPPR